MGLSTRSLQGLDEEESRFLFALARKNKKHKLLAIFGMLKQPKYFKSQETY